MMFTPYKFQSEAITSIFNFFYRGNKGNPLVVAPTGSGKSIIIACFCGIVSKRWPNQKILVISHVKEILGQNYATIKKHLKNSEIGLYSAGLKSKTIKNITVAGIQSIYNKPELFDQFNIILVDECFVAGTKISTTDGYKKIEDIQLGDEV
jgi:DNA repair protein RadD